MSRPGWVNGGDHPELPFSEQDTSRKAALAMAPVAGTFRARVLLYLNMRSKDGGATDEEGHQYLRMRLSSYLARRNELKNNPKHGEPRTVPAYVVDSGERRVAESGNPVKVWKLTEAGMVAARKVQNQMIGEA